VLHWFLQLHTKILKLQKKDKTMIIVTGGAGFIGSAIVAALEAEGRYDTVVCDTLGDGAKWKNIAKRELGTIIHPNELFGFLAQNTARVEAIIHMGAISSTTEANADLIVNSNFKLSQGLWSWCSIHKKRFIYASSAATYGNGEQGFVDCFTPPELSKYRPLNPYGWSKHVFDRWVARLNTTNVEKPTQCVGLKFFNVYGPNEYHKGDQRSIVHKMAGQILEGRDVKLFKSCHPAYPDGGQMRDFVYIKDCVDVVLWFLENPQESGLFNVGTGDPATFNEVAYALFETLGYDQTRITYIDMPLEIQKHYQNYTQANLSNLRKAGYKKPFTPIKEGVLDYIKNYFLKDDPYL
jgi:ADP-L-glycero-D-manno-heptose 6-epimerase